MGQRVVIVGGGYGGVALATALDDVADVVLVEPKDAFVHSAAALRAVVDPAWSDRVFLPYDRLLTRGRVVQDRARLIAPGRVHLTSDEVIEADHVVLATGTGYPFPAKFFESSTDAAQTRLARLRSDLAACRRVLVVGAGAVGLELTGELTSAFGELEVVVVERTDDLLPGDHLPELRDELRAQLAQRRVRFVFGAPLGSLPPQDVGVAEPFAVRTLASELVKADMWFRCYGSRPATDHLDAALQVGMHHDGTVPVDAHLRLVGQEAVWAIGDVTDVPESKRATAARAHAAVVARNIRDVLEGHEPTATYAPAPELIVLPLGPTGGASQVAGPDGTRTVLGAQETSRIKGADLYSGSMAELFGLEAPAQPAS
jgi:pyruvate/2-oxoglutarate dehydrogenase complex dihydrolipoamide dehydrogenase (E3) component